MTYSDCASVALVIQHAGRVRRIVIVACPALQYFSTLYHKRYDFVFKKNIIEQEMYILDFLYNNCLKYF
jgi:hypothetical protein